ncbi:MAG: hypothetical protein NTY35_17805 [Planctomycetota bacterium]|nr:hypothetical protein [Planctomycetota bacterium]
MTHEIEIVPEHDTARIPPHAKPFADRMQKLEALPLGDLAQRVAAGLARLRAGFGLEPRATDPWSALLAALPNTELARRGVDLERDLVAAQALVLERERAAADVERRSESLKEALRDRSADLALALARAEEAPAAKRELDSVRARLAEVELERDRAAADLARSLAENTRVAEALAALAAERAAARAEHGAAAEERERFEGSLAETRRELETARSAVAPRLDFLRAALLAAEARTQATRDVEDLEKAAHLDRIGELDREVALLRRERAELSTELARVRGETLRDGTTRSQQLADAQHALAAREAELEALRRELAWRQREMDAVLAESSGLRWKLLGGELGARVARWSETPEREARP